MISICFSRSLLPKLSDASHGVRLLKKMCCLDALGIFARLSVLLSRRPSEFLSRRGDEAQVLLDLLYTVRYRWCFIVLLF
jgi:hypothetical protein